MPHLQKAAAILKLKSCWLKRILSAVDVVMKGFLKAANSNMTGLPKTINATKTPVHERLAETRLCDY